MEVAVMRFAAALPAWLMLGALAPSVMGARGGGQDAAPPAASSAVPASAAAMTNPVKPTPEGLAHAKKVYGYDCAICHGANGDGKGEIASSMKAAMRDFSDPAVQAQSDGTLFYIIQKGKGEMPPEGDRGKPEDMWNMVSYVRTFKK
jgi:mono/diheme cytochrome c family protein